jgi:hypothetical protein
LLGLAVGDALRSPRSSSIRISVAWRDTIAQHELIIELAEKLYAAMKTSEVR